MSKATIDTTEVRGMITTSVEREVQKKTNDMTMQIQEINTRLDLVQGDLTEIKKCLLGDGVYEKSGMYAEHKEMFRSYSEIKVALKIWKLIAGFLGLTSAASIISNILIWRDILQP